MIEPKNEFEETLYFSSKRNQRELIKLIEKEIDRIKSQLQIKIRLKIIKGD